MADEEIKHVVGFSGGIDSQACARWVLNRYPAENVILLNSDAGGNEHPLTVEFVEWYSENVHPVTTVTPIVADMGDVAKKRVKDLGLSPTDPLTFDLLADLKQAFPGNGMQFCTLHLKLRPSHRWMRENLAGVPWKRYSGVRREESKKRVDRKPVEWDDFFGCELHHPIVDWSKSMCFDYVKLHGEQINPLYMFGFGRVGCAPCVNLNKDDVRAWATRFPEMIDKVREWERKVGKTFYKPIVAGRLNWIDDVVRWSKTVHGGKQLGLHVLYEPASCESAYGLCE